MSRAGRPKFLLPLLSTRSLLQQTVDRTSGLTEPWQTLIVCGPAHAEAIGQQLPEVPKHNVVVEPSPKGSGPAIGLAAAIVARHDPDAVMGSFAADHDVRDEAAFRKAVRVAIAAAQTGHLATIGLTPTRAETGYGYIERTDEAVVLHEDGKAFRAARFVEKPDRERAAAYIESGRFLWNASMFVWQARTLLAAMERLQPALFAGVQRIAAAWGTPDQERVLNDLWPTIPESTIDHGIMERADRIAVVPAEMGWSDVGDWHGLGQLIAGDPDGNSGLGGEVLHVGSTNSAVWTATGRLIATVGLDNVAVIDTPDALLVVNRSQAQDVRAIVDRLKVSGRLDRL
jgi:mannose-1-phosphate guanylyltransferase